MKWLSKACLLFVLVSTSALPAAPATLLVSAPWARATAPGQDAGGAFLSLGNPGREDDQLVSASSPVAREVQIHTMVMDGEMMRMRQLPDGLTVPAGGRVELKPGGLHLMFVGLRAPLREGAEIPLTLLFRRAGAIAIQVPVRPALARDATGAVP